MDSRAAHVTKTLDLLDIQGNIVRPYGRFGFPLARYLLLNVRDSRRGRDWLGQMIPRVTTAATLTSAPSGGTSPARHRPAGAILVFS